MSEITLRLQETRVRAAAFTAGYLIASVPLALACLLFIVAAAIPALLLMPAGGVGARIALWATDVIWRVAMYERTLANRLIGARVGPLPPLPQPLVSWRGVEDRLRNSGVARALALIGLKLPVALAGILLGVGPFALALVLMVLGAQGISSPSSERFVGPWSLGAGIGLLMLVLAGAAAIVSVAVLDAITPPLRRLVRKLLSNAPAAGSPAREMLAESLGDVTLSIAYWLPDREIFVDESGLPVELPEPGSGRAWTSVDSGGRRLAAIIHDADLDTSAELVQAAAAASSLALDNERLKADLRARLEELRASRARIVEAGDAARRRLERDLHDGAQQQLVALSIDLRLLKSRLSRDADTAELIDAASQKLAEALSELRELARGIHPAILTERGLGPAVAALARRLPTPVECSVDAEERLPATVEAAAYFVVSEGLANVAKYSQAENVSVRVTEVEGALEVEVSDDGVGGASTARGSGLSGLSDRVSALDGVLTIASPAGAGTRIVARIPIPKRLGPGSNGNRAGTSAPTATVPRS